MKKVLITGGCGFIGHHFVEHFLKNTDWEIVVWDKLTYASFGFDRLRDIKCFDDKRVKVLTVDMASEISEGVDRETRDVDYVISLASESHVDKSIENPVPFIQNNVNLILNLLEWARKKQTIKKIVLVSTDEVFGPAPEGVNYKEGDRFCPSNPYSASKASQECIARAYANTYGMKINIVRFMNNFGERQHPEKFIPLVIRKVLLGEKVFIHASADKKKAGSRFWLHARNAAVAVHFILENTNEFLDKHDATKGVFNVVGEKEIDNLSLAKFIADVLNKPLNYELVDFHSSRPGHDLRYALDGSKLKSLGFSYPKTLEESLTKTINWYLEEDNKHKWLNL